MANKPVFYSVVDVVNIPIVNRDTDGVYFLRTTGGFQIYRVSETPERDWIPMDFDGFEVVGNKVGNLNNPNSVDYPNTQAVVDALANIGTDNVVRLFELSADDLTDNSEQGVIDYINSTGLTITEREVVLIKVVTPEPLVLDVATEAVLDYADLHSYVKSSKPFILKLDAFIRDVKSAGLWAKFDVLYWLVGDGDLEFKCINLVNPAISGTPTGGLINADDGIKGNEVDGWVGTNLTVSSASKWGLDEAGAVYHVVEESRVANRSAIFGNTGSSYLVRHNQSSYGNNRFNSLGGTSLDASGEGFKSVGRMSSSFAFAIGDDLVEQQSTTPAPTSLVNGDFSVFYHTGGGANMGSAKISMIAIGEPVRGQDAANFRQLILNNL